MSQGWELQRWLGWTLWLPRKSSHPNHRAGVLFSISTAGILHHFRGGYVPSVGLVVKEQGSSRKSMYHLSSCPVLADKLALHLLFQHNSIQTRRRFQVGKNGYFVKYMFYWRGTKKWGQIETSNETGLLLFKKMASPEWNVVVLLKKHKYDIFCR